LPSALLLPLSCHAFWLKRPGNFAAQQLPQLLLTVFCNLHLHICIGATLGGLTGAFVGAKTKMGLMYGAAVGVKEGSFLSIKLFQISLLICSSNDSALATRYLLQPINVFESATPFIQVPWNKEGLSEDSMDKIPKMRITEENDLLPWETVHRLPQCHHTFHISCVQKWLMGHKSCPLCRRNF
ncbi:hypothetical protein V6Z12_D02G117300, partial [Gossypium hirsutum]